MIEASSIVVKHRSGGGLGLGKRELTVRHRFAQRLAQNAATVARANPVEIWNPNGVRTVEQLRGGRDAQRGTGKREHLAVTEIWNTIRQVKIHVLIDRREIAAL